MMGVATWKGGRDWAIYKSELSSQTWLKEKAERMTRARFDRLKADFCIPQDAVWEEL